ncbi:MAG: helix-turn-helix domain-containing protein [Candidatus Margulisiibacteriota bacterium]
MTENEFKNKVRGMAVERGMTLEQVADAMGQSRANLYKKLANETLRYKELKVLLKVLGKKMVLIDE